MKGTNMGIKYIHGISTLIEVGGTINAPTQVPVLLEDGNYDLRDITHWSPTNPNFLDTSVAADHVYIGTVNGTGVTTFLYSVVVGRPEESNPPSIFPERLDEFGLPKIDIETSDIPAIDAYEALKAKSPRHIGDDAALHQYRELLHMKMILARDINHARNCIIEIEKYLLKHPFTNYYNSLRNVGRGAEVFAGFDQNYDGKEGKFRTLRGEGEVEVDELSNEVEIFVRNIVAGENIEIERTRNDITISSTGGDELSCDSHINVGSVSICPNEESDFPTTFTNDGITWGNFGWKMKELEGGFGQSLLMQFGVGQNAATREGSGYILKAQKSILIEIKTKSGGSFNYEGIELGNGVNQFYSDSSSRVKGAIIDKGFFGNY